MDSKNFSKLQFALKTVIALALIILIPASLAGAQNPNLIQNGSFEDGFIVGLDVANEWGYFRTDNADGSFHDDTWELVVVDGEHSQMIEIINGRTTDSYAGIYQTVDVSPGQTYELSFKGMVRSDEGSIEASNFGYRLQYALDLTGNQDWEEVEEWIELLWDEQQRTGPTDGTAFRTDSHDATFAATGEQATLFFRAWKKWADQSEGNFNIDAVRLTALDAPVYPTPDPDPEEPLPETGSTTQDTNPANAIWLIASASVILLLISGAFLNQRRRHQDGR